MENKPRGRPPKPPGEVLTDVIQVKVSANERRTIEAAAEGSVSKWARDVLLRAAKRRVK